MVTWRSSGRLSKAYTGAEAERLRNLDEFFNPDPGPAPVRHGRANIDRNVTALIMRPIIADLFAAGTECCDWDHDAQRHVIVSAIAGYRERCIDSTPSLGRRSPERLCR